GLQQRLHVVERVGRVGDVEDELALRAQRPHQPLGDGAEQAVGQEVRVDAQVEDAGDHAGRHGGVDRREHQVAAVGGADGNVGGLRVADFADHDHVGGLAQYAAQQFGKAHVDTRVDLRLADALDRILDGILDGVDLAFAVVEEAQTGVQRGGL